MEQLTNWFKKNLVYLAGGVAILLAVLLIVVFVRHLVLQTEYKDDRAALVSMLPEDGEVTLIGPEGEAPGWERDVDYYMQYIQDNSTICGGRGPKTVSPDALELKVGDFSVWFTDQDGIWGWVQWQDGDRLVSYNVRGTLDFEHLFRYYHLAVQNRAEW